MPVAYSSSISARSRRPSGVDDVGLRQERVHVLDRQELRQRRPGRRRLQIVGRAAVEAPIEDEKPVEAAHGGDGPRDRPRRLPAPMLLPHERVERLAVEVFEMPRRARRQTRASAARSRP